MRVRTSHGGTKALVDQAQKLVGDNRAKRIGGCAAWAAISNVVVTH